MIKTLIFDFGDVFINLDKSATERILKLRGIYQITEDMYRIASKYEKGLISTEILIDHFLKMFPHITKNEFIHAWNAIILDFPEYRLEFIETLAKSRQYKMILLSNTNELHIEQVIKNMTEPKYHRFRHCFDKFYLSHEIHLSKPNWDIYNYVISENNLISKECLFIDDTKANTDAASQLGIHVWNNNPAQEDIVHLFKAKQDVFNM